MEERGDEGKEGGRKGGRLEETEGGREGGKNKGGREKEKEEGRKKQHYLSSSVPVAHSFSACRI